MTFERRFQAKVRWPTDLTELASQADDATDSKVRRGRESLNNGPCLTDLEITTCRIPRSGVEYCHRDGGRTHGRWHVVITVNGPEVWGHSSDAPLAVCETVEAAHRMVDQHNAIDALQGGT